LNKIGLPPVFNRRQSQAEKWKKPLNCVTRLEPPREQTALYDESHVVWKNHVAFDGQWLKTTHVN
jgi:hypothetical protein